MDVRSPFFQNVATALIGILFLNPIVTTAAELAVSAAAAGNTSLGQAGNGVPIVNIATPNGNGLSHNQFSDYNVGQQGLILNNATDKTQSTQLGGIVLGNPNLQGQAANLILNEVNGGSPSQLKGYTEVAGQAAHVIVANPHGIACDGCGFINTPRVTLSTGKPVVENGRLKRFDVEGGQIAIEGAGLNASNVDQFDLITRSAKLNAELYANRLNVITGRNEVDADDLSITAKADNGSDKPQLAIDSSALGGMYAGAIRLVGTEQGVGVKLAGNMAASAGDIQIDANGKLSLAQAAASAGVQLKAQSLDLAGQVYAGTKIQARASGELVNRQSLAARERIELTGGQLINQGVIEAGVNPDDSRNSGGDIALNGQSLRNGGSLVASRGLDVQTAQLLDNQGGTLNAKGQTKIGAGQLDNRQGRILADSTLALDAGAVDNREAGLIQSQGDAEVKVAGVLQNQQGQLASNAKLGVQAAQLNNQDGTLSSRNDMDLSAQAIDSRGQGRISSAGRLQVRAADLDAGKGGEVSAKGALQVDLQGRLNLREGGRLIAGDDLSLSAQTIDSGVGGVISAKSGAQIEAHSLSNDHGGEISAGGALGLEVRQLDNTQSGVIGSAGALTLKADSIDNRYQGQITSGQTLTLTAASLDNSESGRVIAGGDLQLLVERLLNRSKGVLSAGSALRLQGSSLDNSAGGQVLSGAALNLELTGGLDNRAQGTILSQADLAVKAAQVTNTEQGRIASKGQLTANLTGLDQQGGGQLLSETALTLDLAGGHLNNSRQGLLATPGSLLLKNVATIDNSQGGEISSDHAFSLESAELNNSAGKIASGEALELRITRTLLNNLSGVLSAANDLHLVAGSLNNSAGGRLSSTGDMTLAVTGELDNHDQGNIAAGGKLDLKAAALNNAQGGQVSSQGELNAQLGRLSQRQGGQLLGESALNLHVGALDNSQQGLLTSQGALRIDAGSVDNQSEGEISSAGTLQLKTGSLNNQGGLVAAEGPLDIESSGLLDNSQQGVLAAEKDFTLSAGSLVNRDQGLIQSKGDLSATIQGTFDNVAGSLRSGRDLLLVSGALDNRSATLVAAGQLWLSTGELNNAQGTLASGGATQLYSTTLNNDAGKLSSQGDLQLTSGTASNRNGGAILSGGQLNLQADSLDSGAAGRVVANGVADVRLTGQLSLHGAGQLLSGGALLLRAQSIDNADQGLISAKGEASVEATSIDNRQSGEISSSQSLELKADQLNNSAQGRLIAAAGLKLVADHVLNHSLGVLSAGQALTLEARLLDNSVGGRILSGALLTLTADQLVNSNEGRVRAGGDLLLTANHIDNRQQGKLLSGGKLQLQAEQLDSSAKGQIAGQEALDVRVAQLLNLSAGGQLVGEGELDLKAGSLDSHQQGLIAAKDDLRLESASIDNSKGGEISSKRGLSIAAGSLDNSDGGRVIGEAGLNATLERLNNSLAGLLASNTSLTLSTKQIDNSSGGTLSGAQLLSLTSETLDNHDAGRLLSGGDLRLRLDQLSNSGAGLLSSRGNLLLQGGALDNRGGTIIVDGRATVAADSLDSSEGGQLSSQGDLSVEVATLNQRNGGELLSNGRLDLRAVAIDNSTGGLIAGRQGLAITASTLTNQGGELSSAANLAIQATRLDNSGAGKVIAGNALALTVEQLLNRAKGVLSGSQGITLSAGSLDNSLEGTVVSQAGIDLRVSGALSNQGGGALLSQGPLKVVVDSLDNRQGGILSSQGRLDLDGNQLNNQGGTVIADGALSVAGNRLDNSQQGTLNSKGDLALDLAQIDNSNGGSIAADGKLGLKAERLDNGAQGQVASKGDLNAEVGELIQQGGELISQGRLAVQATTLDNSQGGLIAATQGLDLRATSLDNSIGGEVSSRAAVVVNANELNNSGAGRIIGDAGLTLTVQRLLNHSRGLLSGRDGLLLKASTLDNSQGGTLTSQHMLDVELSGALDNHGQGALISEGGLKVRSAALDNASGILSSAGTLEIVTGTLNNRGGKLVTDDQLSLASSTLDNSQAGRISAKGDLGITTGTLANQQSGSITSNGRLQLKAAQANNSAQGRIASQGALNADVQGLDQHDRGELLSETTLSLNLNGGHLDNSNQGLIASPGALLVQNAASLDNNQGGEISSTSAFSLVTDELNNSAGRIISGAALELRITRALLNNLQGVLSAAGKLKVTAASLDNSGAGILASKDDLELNLGGKLDNHGEGVLSATKALTIDSASLDNSNKGLLTSGGALQLTTGAANNSQGGTLASQTILKATTADLDNQGGVLSSQQALTLTAGQVDNRNSGLITGTAGLTLNAASLDSSLGGEVSAKGNLNVTVARLIQQQGRLIGEAGLSLNLKGGDLDNRGGLISARGPLTVSNLRALDNRQGGEISSAQSFALLASSLDNGDQGKLISSQQLSVQAASLRNANGGLLSGWKGLDVKGGSLDNAASGTLSSREGNLVVELSGALDNHDQGALVSKGNLQLKAASLNNANGVLSAEGALTADITGTLDNQNGGLIDSAGQLVVSAQSLNNRSGQLSAQQSLILSSAGALDNSGGKLSSNGAMTLSLLGALTNSGNAQLASGGPLLLKAASVDNRGGKLASQGLLNLVTGNLNNSASGTLASRNDLTLSLGGALTNSQDGLIYSELGKLSLTAQSLDNGAGTLQSQGDLNLKLSGALNNQGGRILTQAGSQTLQAGSLDNSSGVLSSVSSWLKLVTGGLFDNSAGGITQAQSLDIQADQGIDNSAGHLSALNGDNLIRTSGFANQGGGLYAANRLSLTGSSFNNRGEALGQGGKVAARQIDFSLSGALDNHFGTLESEGTLGLQAVSLDNTGGALRALGSSGKTQITSAALDNRFGVLETANADFALDVASLQNTFGKILHTGSGTFDIATGHVMQAGGSLVTNGALTLNAASWTNSSVLQAGRLTLNIGTFTQTASGQLLASQSLSGSGDTWVNDGLLASDGSLNLNLTGGYSGNGRLSSLGDLSLNAASIDLPSAARITGGGLTTVTSSGLLTNRGKLTSAADLTVRAGTLNNHGTLGSAEQLRLYAPTLLNENGLIFSGDDMALRVDNFTNRYADVYSLGGLDIAKDDQQGRAGAVENISATLESAADMRINAQRLDNRTDVYSLGRQLLSGYIAIRCYDCSGDHYNVDYVAKEFYQGSVLDDSPSAFIAAGGNFNFTGGDLFNRQSSISAAGNIEVQAANFSNIGAIGGSIERTRVYNTGRVTDGTVDRFVAGYVTPYNQRNNPEFPNIYYVDGSGNTRTAIARAGRFRDGGGREADWVEEVRLFDSVTDERLFIPHSYYGDQLPVSQYDADNLLQLPTALNQYSLISDVEVATDGGAVRSATVQAGGDVSIQATQNLENSVIRQDYLQSGGVNRVADTAAEGTGKTTVVHLNSQLPPSLQQQQVNPLSLPGFSLPQGQNGLFRLSGQEVQGSAASTAQTSTSDRTLSGRSIALGQGEQSLSYIDTQGRAFAIATQGSLTAGQVEGSAWSLANSGGSLLASGTTGAVDSGAATAPVTLSGQTLPAALPLPGSTEQIQRNAGTVASIPAVSGQPVSLGNSQNHPGVPLAELSQVVPSANQAPLAIAAPTAQPVTHAPGMPAKVTPPKERPYLIETNPELTNLKQFLGSDYLLGNLGVNPDNTQKRLGDGLYEQRLVREAVVARTGQRFLNGLTSDEAMFRYLMDNSIASKQALNLSLGVTLTAEQVAALTHDIVWLEEYEVNGEKVLVPVLYLAQAKGRLAPNGALIQGQDVALISGGNLSNAGTLRASNNLSAVAGGDIANRGLIEAGNRLDLLATNSIRNAQGGIIAGRDISAIALVGDIINERSVTRDASTLGRRQQLQDYVDSAARIEAANSLSLSAGRDLANLGGVLESRGDIDISAGRDLTIASVEERSLQARGKNYRDEHVTQLGAEVSAGRDIQISAGRDLTAIASRIDARRDIALTADEDVTLAAAANEDHFYSKSKKVTRQKDHVDQQATEIKAGGDVAVTTGNDLTLVASTIEAGDEAYLVAGSDLALLSAENLDHSFYFMKKKSSSGKKSRLDETTTITNVGSSITSGKDVVLIAGQDLKVMGSGLSSSTGDASLTAGQDVLIGSVVDSTSARHESSSSKRGFGGLKSSKVKDQLKETRTEAVGSLISGDEVSVQAGRDATVTGSALVSTDDLRVQAGRDLTVDAAENTFSRRELHKAKKRDLSGIATGNHGGLDDITGKLHLSIGSQKHNGNAEETTLTGSMIGSSEGDVSLTAGRALKVVASDLVSTQDMTLTGADVTIAAGLETAKQTSKDSARSLAVGRVVGGTVVDTVQSIRNDVRAAQNADDDRLKAVKGAQAVLSAYNAYQTGDAAAANISDGKPANSSGSFIKIGTEVASTRSKGSSEYSSQTAKQATLTSGDSLAIVATGSAANSAGDIHITGSALKADDTLLLAKHDITLESAQSRRDWDNQNSTNRVSVGASFNIGSQNGFTLDLGAKTAKGLGTGHELSQVNSTLDTGTLILRSGQDTTLAGAQIHAETIKADIGGNLNIASRQDEASSKNQQKSGGVGGSICVPPFCYGATVTASGNLAASKSSSAYQAVIEQSGLYAGQGGYDINVGNTTNLQGAVIASEAEADKNHLSTNRLEVSDLKNRSEVKSQAASLSASYSSSGATQDGSPVKADSAIGGGIPLSLKESEHSYTRSAISEGSIVVRDPVGANDLVGLNRDTANANQAIDQPDEKALQERMDLIQSTAELGKSVVTTVSTAQQEEAKAAAEKAGQTQDPADKLAAQTAYNEAKRWDVGGDKRVLADIATGLLAAGLGGVGGGTALGIVANTSAADTYKKIGDYADQKRDAADDDATKAAWAEGGAARILLHTLAGTAQGLAGGNVASSALGAGASAAIMPAIGEELAKSGLSPDDQKAVATLIATGVGATAAASGDLGGQINAGSSAAGVDLYNRQLHEREARALEVEAKRLEEQKGKPGSSVSWEDLLLLASGSELDAVENARLQAIVETFGSDNPEGQHFAEDLLAAQEVISSLAARNIPLTWSDGKQIVANGAPVYAFQATAAQYQDHQLFNNGAHTSSGDNLYLGNNEIVPSLWKTQFGERNAARYFNEILSSSTDQAAFDDAFERVSVVAQGGVGEVTADLDLALMLVSGGKANVKTVLSLLRAREAAGTAEALGASGAKGAGGSAPDFYTRVSGETVPATGYRYVSSDAPYLQDLLSTGTIPANSRGTYISFDNLGVGAAGKLQVPHDAAIKIEFDTKQILDDVTIPQGQWGKADYLEPITTDFPQFGPGGATQAVTTKPIIVNKVIDTNTGKVLYERGQ